MIRDPNEVREEAEVPPADVGEARKRGEVLASITASYFFLRRGLAFLALAFPVGLWLLAGFQDSLSAYYHCSREGLHRRRRGRRPRRARRGAVGRRDLPHLLPGL